MHKTISSLSLLINQLKGASKEEYGNIGVVLDIPIKELEPYAHWSKVHYTRNCIVREENFELILLCWEPGQSTPIHCHGGEECWVYMVDGNIEESHYNYDHDTIEIEKIVSLKKGDKSFMSDEMGYHRLVNNSTHRSISLHLYMDPIDDCTVYDRGSKAFVPRSLSYHSFEGVLESIEA